MKHISQREARRLKKQVEALTVRDETRCSRYGSDYPGGVNIDTIGLDTASTAALTTAQRLGFALVGRMRGSELLVYAVKP